MFTRKVTREFVETFCACLGLPPLERYLFIEGGAPAVENTLKAAMDWKVRKNMAAGRANAEPRFCIFAARFMGAAATP